MVKVADDAKGSRKLLSESALNRITLQQEQRIKFSFRFFDRNIQAFNCGGIEAGWFISLLDHLKTISELTVDEFRNSHKYRYRVHGHDWSRLKYRYHLPEGLFEQVEQDCIQFSISTANGRVHGFMISNTFYLVWLDPHHNLYPSQKHGGETLPPWPLTPYEQAEQELNLLQQKVLELEQLLDDRTNPEVDSC